MEIETRIKHYKTSQECAEAIHNMLQVKQQWLEYVKKREEELAIS